MPEVIFLDPMLEIIDRASGAHKTPVRRRAARGLSSAISLTPTETNVLLLMRNEDLSSQEAADKMVVSKCTIDFHLYNIYQKLGVHNLTQALRAAEKLKLIPPETNGDGQNNPHGIKLTPTEQKVICLKALGDTSEEVADKMVVSKRTIDFHLRNIYQKLGVRKLNAAIGKMRRLGLIPDDIPYGREAAPDAGQPRP